MNPTSSWTRIKYGFALAVALGAIGVAVNFVGCGTSTGTVTYATTDPYVYTAYYPADVAYSTVYWTDDWAYYGLYALQNGPAPIGNTPLVTTSDGGSPGTMAPSPTTTPATGAITTAGDVVRALARGLSVCPNQVAFTPKSAAPACEGGTTRSGVNIVFNGCQTPGGSTLTGTIDVTSTRTATAASCDATTSIMLSHTSTITNLSYVSASGDRLVIPSQTITGATTYTFGQIPPTVSLSFTGELQRVTSSGAVTADHNYTGTTSFSFAGSGAGYTIDGGLTVVDNLGTAGAALTLTGLRRVTTCCRPVSGTIGIVQTSGIGPGTHTWTFGPGCGESAVDGMTATLPACI